MDSQDIFAEDYEEACTELGNLLKLNIAELDFAEIKKIIKKTISSWHPDKNKDNPEKVFLENKLKKLNSAWTVYKIFKQSCESRSSSEECDSTETAKKIEDTKNNDSNKTDNENEIDNLQKCVNELCRLLGCKITELTYKELSSLV
ncbi:j domain-containing protein [Caerostris darwini]|uniref:J domain-containing protein n=1 Tax=Caerostris darwini TaxID=1538125 RepID=A0AAV4UJ72_9ARAC|nr:j domain-containing protein [Caerostris darwini]